MTTEVVIMNKGAVALAADSAVTICGGKVFNSANKVFMLAPGYPIGILLYSNAEFMGIPWEILIKKFRDHVVTNQPVFTTLEDCGEAFISFLRDKGEALFTLEHQRQFIGRLIHTTMQSDVRGKIHQRLRDVILNTAAPVSAETVATICHETIDQLSAPWRAANELPNRKSVKQLSQEFDQLFGDIFEASYQEHLAKLPITAEDKQRLKEMSISWLYKDWWFLAQSTGVVFAGYGNSELFPTCVVYRVESYLCNELKFTRSGLESVTLNKQAVLLPFAQSDMVMTFVTGIHPRYNDHVQHTLRRLVERSIPEAFFDAVKNLDDQLRNEFTHILSEVSQKILKDMLSDMQMTIAKEYTDPIMGIVAALPKDELATMAETLVSITSFMQRVSHDRETVGGPVDVAVISKKDGFIWIKRKHYFDKEYNYHFFHSRVGGILGDGS